jgi:hypothetical protein
MEKVIFACFGDDVARAYEEALARPEGRWE